MELKESKTIDIAVIDVNNAISNKIESIIYCVNKKTCVLPALTSEYNEEYCLENNIDIVKMPNEGGALVITNGDIEIAHISKYFNNDFKTRFLNYISEYLIQKGINNKITNNDILIEKYKICGCSSVYRNEMLFTAIHLSINCELELIKNICQKEMIKVPKGLSDYGITTNELLEKVLLFLEKEKG